MAAENTVLEDWQRRVMLMLLLPGLGFIAIAAFVTPAGAWYWLAIAAVLVGGMILGAIAGGARGRALDGWLRREQPPRKPLVLAAPAALPADTRAGLQAALLPMLLATLSAAADRMGPREKAAALALVEAGATAPAGEARAALAQDLPRLISALAAGGAAEEAEALVRRLAQGGKR